MTDAGLICDLRGDAGVLAIAVLVGAVGGLAQSFVAKDPADATASPWKSLVVGVVAAIGALWASRLGSASESTTSGSALGLIGQSLLAGYFGRAVLAVLQTRVTAALERDRKERAIAVARDALDLTERDRVAHPTLTDDKAPVVAPDVAALRARLAELDPH